MTSQVKCPRKGNRIPFDTFLKTSERGYCGYLCTDLTERNLKEASERLISHCKDTLAKLTEEKESIIRYKIGQSHATNRLRRSERLPLDTEDFLTWRVDKGIAPLWNYSFRTQKYEYENEYKYKYDGLVVLCGVTKVPEEYLSAITQAVTSSETTEATEKDSDVLAQENAPIHHFTNELHKRLVEHFEDDTHYEKFTVDETKKIDEQNKAAKEASCGAIYLLVEFEKRKNEETGDDKWRAVLESQNKKIARKLLATKILPENELFQKICKLFGKKSHITRKICKLICRKIRRNSRNVVDVWPAYEYLKSPDLEHRLGPELQPASKSDDIVFVVITKKGETKIEIEDFNYKTYLRQENKFSEESTIVNEEEKQKKPKIDLQPVADLINKEGEKLMNSHSNISIILPSSLKSTNFKPNDPNVQAAACIVLYTHIKGYIPISEDPFPTKIKGVDVDVREGAFTFHQGQPDEYHDTLKIGLKICSEIKLGNDHVSGTLGGFVDYPEHGVCCFTCAHVLYPELQGMRGKKYKKKARDKPSVFQPNWLGDERQADTMFGSVLEAVYRRESDIEMTGVDVALVKVERRGPVTGDFPRPFDKDGLESFPSSYNGGTITSDLNPDQEVYKYGAETRRTTGIVKNENGIPVRIRFPHSTKSLRLHNQMIIEGRGFARGGDSGALVFTKDNDGNLAALGMLEGGDGDKWTCVTPISAILGALNVPTLKSFNV